MITDKTKQAIEKLITMNGRVQLDNDLLTVIDEAIEISISNGWTLDQIERSPCKALVSAFLTGEQITD